MNRWKSVWDARRLDPSRGTLLAKLMAADGLDTGFGDMAEAPWREFIRGFANVFALSSGDRVLEVGCGAGAFLLDLYEHGVEVAGIDRSLALVEIARVAMPTGRFTVAEATAFAATEPFDVVVSCGVFLYFESYDYARAVIQRMARTAVRGVAILDVPDRAIEAEALAYRRASFGPEEYAVRYAGLDHLYYDRQWLADELEECGLSNVRTESQSIPGYANGKFRFNAYGFKKT